MKFSHPIYVTQPLLPDLEELFNELKSVWESKILTNGAGKHQALESSLAKHLKTPYLSLFNNGTIALLTAIKALDLTGEIITTPFTFPATPHVLSWNQISPVFCDIDPLCMTIDPKKIEEKITSKTTGILGVHVYGIPCDVAAIEEIAKKYRLKVIYDAAHAFGVEIDGKGIGTFGDLTMFSFHATKLFHTAEGGAITGTTEELKTKIDLLKNFGIKNEEEVSEIGINGKLNEIQACLGLINLKLVEKECKVRQEIRAIYKENFKAVPGLTIPELPSNVKPSYQYMVIRIDQKLFGRSRDEVYLALKEQNVITRKYFYPLCSNYACYQHLPKSFLPEANKATQEVLCLPFYGALGKENAHKIAEMIVSLQVKN